MAEEILRRILSVDDGVDDSRRITVNATQSLYSGIVPPPPGDMTVLSSAIWHGTVYAGTVLSESIGDLSSFLCRELNWRQEELSRRLAPAQIDAAAMIINGMKNGDRRARDFLLADEAGFGKGRVLMTVALWCSRNGILPILLTKTSALFSNLWQDAIDIGADNIFRQPFLINEQTRIVGLNGQGTLFGNISPKLHRTTIRDLHDLPDQFGLVMLTWSQLASKTNPKLDWLLHLGKTRKIMALGDECHTAVSRSALISQSAVQIRKASVGSCDTSATSARHVMNMASYQNIYPWLADLPLHTMESLPTRHQAWLAEMSVQSAIGHGKMIRREIDRSGVAIDVIEPASDVIARNNDVTDHFALILSEMRELWSLVRKYINDRNIAAEMRAESVGKTIPKSAKLFVAGNFYARMETICLQFDACMASDMTIEQACQQLLSGIQPTIILNMTMESAAKQILDIDTIGSDDADAPMVVSENKSDDDEVIDIDLANRALTFPDIMTLMLDNIASIVVSKQKSRLDLNAAGMEPLLVRYKRIAEMIERMPEMPASPIDYIREGIIKRGEALFSAGEIPWAWNVGEISGRTAYLKDGRYVRRDEEMNDTIIKYNSGFLDCVIMTSAGSTGGSMHHTAGPTPESNLRRRPHSQIEVVGSRDPIERVQTRGRIARRGVISTPHYSILISGTPYSRCRLAIETAKEKMLNAAVSGSHRAGVDDEINMLSPAGDSVARDILVSNPDLADFLGIDLIYADPSDETWHVRRLMGRSMLLQCRDAENVMTRFRNGMARESRHVRNIAVSQIGDGWRRGDVMTLLEAGDKTSHAQSIWSQDTGIASISRTIPVAGRTRNELPPLAREVSDLTILQGRAEAALMPYLETVRPTWAKSVRHALSVANKPGLYPNIKRNPCVVERERYTRFMSLLPALKIGEAFVLPDAMGEQRPAILTGVTIPANPLQWRRYSLDYIVPGDETVYVTDLVPFLESESIHIPDNVTARSRFPESSDKERTETLFLLQGNIHRAILHAARADVGRKVEFGDDAGRFSSGIVLTRRERQAILAAPIFVPSVDCAKQLLERGADLFCSNSMTIRRTASGIVIQIDTKGRNGRLDVILAGISGCKASSPSFPIPLNEVGQALEAVSYFYSISCSSHHRKVMTNILDGDLAGYAPESTASHPKSEADTIRPEHARPARTRIPVPVRGVSPPEPAASPAMGSRASASRPAPVQRAISTIKAGIDPAPDGILAPGQTRHALPPRSGGGNYAPPPPRRAAPGQKSSSTISPPAPSHSPSVRTTARLPPVRPAVITRRTVKEPDEKKESASTPTGQMNFGF